MVNLKQRARDYIGWNSLLWRTLSTARHPLRSFIRWKRSVTHDSRFCFEHELEMCSLLPEKLLFAAIERIQPRTVLDVGCGAGRTLDWFLDHGVKCHGIEGSRMAVTAAKNGRKITVADFRKPIHLHQTFDLVYCYEVVEHIHPMHLDAIMATLTSHGSHVLISAAHPGQGGDDHFNEQPPGYWIEQFKSRNYLLDIEATNCLAKHAERWPENILFFSSKTAS